jgi:hypothetical protein
MKKTLLIACDTLREELEKLMKNIENKLDIKWIKGGYHVSPENLRKQIQIEISKYDGIYEEIILAYGFCGGGIEHLEAKSSYLIIPRVEDCISLLLGGDCERSHINDRDKALFITKGWIRTFNEMEGLNIKSIKMKYGDKLAKELYKEINNGYCNIDIINSGAYDMTEIDEELSEIQEALEIPCKKIDCNFNMMENMLKRDWSIGFVIKNPGQKVERSDYY